MADINSFREKLQSLLAKFEKDKAHYVSKGYPEAQVRLDFLNPFFKALGWDIENQAQKPPHERDVIVELSPETTGRPDYNFRINGATKFFVEAKAPSVALDDINHILQAKSYAWSTKEVYFVVLTDFEEFRLYDASLKPNPKFPDEGLILGLKYTDYLNNIEKLWELSKERIEQGSLEALLPKDTKSKRLRIPPDKSFLEDLTEWRTELAKDLHKRNPEFDVKLLNDVVQKLLDRIIFIRIAEDRRIRPDKELMEIVALWKEEGKRKSIMSHLLDLFHEVNDDLNGDIFKPHACERADVDSNLIADVIENLYFPKSRYRFDAIGVELLGSIYERYLGSTIRVTPQRVKVEEKPEVRKAGGVYYTPKYIVDYIVRNTVGKLIEGKTPRQIEKIKILDPACGSGSFLLGAYQYLIDYHLKYYREHPKEAQTLHLFPYWKISPEELSLPIHEKAKILRNNIFGVDIDPQSVEITMMSLYLKALEGERGLLPRKQHLLPSLGNNIKCGNSLIGYDILDSSLFSSLRAEGEAISDDTKSRINPFDWNSKSVGFGEIMNPSQSPLAKGGSEGGFDVIIGNPPYVTAELEAHERDYYTAIYPESTIGKLNTYRLFTHKGWKLLRDDGMLGFIIPNTYLTDRDSQKLRALLLNNSKIKQILFFPENMKVFENVTQATTILLFEKGKKRIKNNVIKVTDPVKNVAALNTEPERNYRQDLFIKMPEQMIVTKRTAEQIAVIEKTMAFGKPFDVFADVYQGEVNVSIYKNSIAVKPKNKNYKPLIRGNNIERYYADLSFSDKKGSWVDAARPFRQHQTGIRIVTQEVSNMQQKRRLNGAVIQNNIYVGHTANYILLKANDYHPNYFAALLNSYLLDFIFQTFNSTNHIPARELKRLPIRTINFTNPSEKAAHDKLVSLVERMLELHKKKNSLLPSAEREKIEREIAVTDEKIDDIIYGLYGVTEEGKRIIQDLKLKIQN
ncbi:MAG: hypothetical protein COW90_05850 [Nitrospirae bacterium CG22_combo_CG10-13_8_21_14_all_44_11]|nr:MAG: hypothetical protein COW90_05850 [Nitrospirae bacterium CG22_combo_CG10-13_8_21_14_all_44_11]